jgi:hypothetical protein
MDKTTDNRTLFADGFDDALIGVHFDRMAGLHRIVYDKDRMIERLMIRDDMSLDESIEYLDFNTWTAYAGEGTPLYVDVMPDRKDIEDYLLIDNQ